MINKQLVVYAVIIMFCFSLIAVPILQACEEQDDKPNYYAKSVNAKNEVKKLNTDQPIIFSQSASLLDRLFERYPVLNQIIDMIIDLLFNWLSNLQYRTS